MNSNQTWPQLSYKSAFTFFFVVTGLNLVFNPLLMTLGISQQMSLFVINSLGISATLSYVLLKLNGFYRNIKQAILLTSLIFTISTVSCYALISGMVRMV